MLVTTAVDPLRRPTSDPLTPTGGRRRMFPASGSGRRGVRRDAVLVRSYLGAGGRLARAFPPSGPRCDRPVGAVPTADNVTNRVRRAEIRPAGRPNG
jgi:hypothetical protein